MDIPKYEFLQRKSQESSENQQSKIIPSTSSNNDLISPEISPKISLEIPPEPMIVEEVIFTTSDHDSKSTISTGSDKVIPLQWYGIESIDDDDCEISPNSFDLNHSFENILLMLPTAGEMSNVYEFQPTMLESIIEASCEEEMSDINESVYSLQIRF